MGMIAGMQEALTRDMAQSLLADAALLTQQTRQIGILKAIGTQRGQMSGCTWY